MNYYKQYMDRQKLPPEFWERIRSQSSRPKNRWRRWAALAACCAVLTGLGLHMTRPAQTPPVEISQSTPPVPEKEKRLVLPRLAFLDNTAERLLEDAAPAPSPMAPAEGAMQYEGVSRTEVEQLFGGEIPEILGWGDFTITSSTNDPESSELYVSAQAEGFQFDLLVKRGQIPDLAGEEGAATLYRGTQVKAVRQAEDLYEIWFLTPEGLGVFYRVKGENGPERTAALAWAFLARKGDEA